MNLETLSESYLQVSNSKTVSFQSPDLIFLKNIHRMRNLIELLAAVHPKKPKCLTKAILLARWMETNKWGYVFKLGWRKSGVAHAWIEIGGRPIDFDGPWREDCQELRKVPINRSLS